MKELSIIDSRLEGRYEVKKLLGRGSYAEIFLAEDTLASPISPHRRVVIKALNVFLHEDLDRDLERTLVENFQNEALALDRVRHPNIISRLGHGTARDLNGTLFHYLVLEYLPGGDLAKAARSRPLGFNVVLSYLEQICAGLSHAHGMKVIHRDIKPQNLLLSGDRMIVKIADFGVARLSESQAPITRVGTNIYAPPEHSPMLSGTTGKLGFQQLTPAADIYSLAKTAYVLFTSDSPRPFANRPVDSFPPRLADKHWSGPLLETLKKATCPDPKLRHQSAEEFWKELSSLASDSAAPVPASFGGLQNSVKPQAVYDPGYDPKAPVRAEFDTDKDIKRPAVLLEKRPGVGMSVLDASPPASGVPDRTSGSDPERQERSASPVPEPVAAPPIREGRTLRSLVIAGLLIAFFAVAIFATYNYVLTKASLPSIYTYFGNREATALMNINLRSDASTGNPRIGLVPKGSRLRILSSNGHWYEVQIVEYGAPKASPDFSDRGWISGLTRRGEDTIKISDKK